MNALALSYQERAAHCHAPQAARLLTLMHEKKTNLALSADVTRAEQLITLAETLGPEICVLKTHIDIIQDFTPTLTQTLVQIAKTHEFLLFEDRKFADIGATVKAQYAGGIYQIAEWANLINAHCLPGPGIVQGLAEVGLEKNRGLILIAEMSSAGHFMTQHYIRETLTIAQKNANYVIGFITQHALSSDPKWLNLTPGVKLEGGADALGQRYVTPELAIRQHGADVIIIGRGITAAENPLLAAQQYRKSGWESYLKRCAKPFLGPLR